MLDWKTKLIAWAIVLIIVGLIVGYALEFKHFSNTLYVERLVSAGLVAGAALGAWIGHSLARRETTIVGKARWWVSSLALSILFMPLIASWVNRLPLSSSTKQITVEFIEEKPFAQERFGLLEGKKIAPDGYYIFVMYQGEIIRLRAGKQQFPGRKRGDIIQLEVRKGNLGFDWVLF